MIVGFSAFGLGNRLLQLGIQKRSLFSNPWGHVIAMGGFGYFGYWMHQLDVRSGEILADQKARLRAKRLKQEEDAMSGALA